MMKETELVAIKCNTESIAIWERKQITGQPAYMHVMLMITML